MLRAALICTILSAGKMPINGTNAFAKAFCGMQYERMLAADVFLFSIFSFNKIKT